MEPIKPFSWMIISLLAGVWPLTIIFFIVFIISLGYKADRGDW